MQASFLIPVVFDCKSASLAASVDQVPVMALVLTYGIHRRPGASGRRHPGPLRSTTS